MATKLNPITDLTDAEILALVKSGRVKVTTAKRSTTYRVADPAKVTTSGVGTPLKDTTAPAMFAKGLTFATWLDNANGDPVKRRAYRDPSANAWLLVDARGLRDGEIEACAREWNANAVEVKVYGTCHVFAVPRANAKAKPTATKPTATKRATK
jgi:hypothetical protein